MEYRQLHPYIAGAFASGYLAEHMPPRETFILMAVLALLLAVLGLWKPQAVFKHAYDQPLARGTTLLGDLKRLVKHRAMYPAVLIPCLFQFSPGSNTPLQFYLTTELHASDAVYGYYYAIFAASFIPVFVIYGYLCKKVSLNKLLWWGTILTVPQMVPLAFVHSANTALLLAMPIGLLGSWIYAQSPAHGFVNCVIVTTAIYALYALILPQILLVPRDLIATADGQRNPQLEAQVLAEIGVTE